MDSKRIEQIKQQFDSVIKITENEKIVFDENITDEEILKTIEIAKKYNLTIILQPKMPMNKGFQPEEIFYKYFKKYKG